ncbi:hypothetical protein MYXE_09190 [Mycobacterium xenopi]|uniref:Uncharacterized protein n=1 Tax=Mycobacterium xenopi TaxID=1789 RepID=A0AAD1M067_MYCXE|nr:hypothetical protein MYXE_09190 [Mycobacterium xenopi]
MQAGESVDQTAGMLDLTAVGQCIRLRTLGNNVFEDEEAAGTDGRAGEPGPRCNNHPTRPRPAGKQTSLTAMSSAATIARFFAVRGVLFTNSCDGLPAALAASFHSTAGLRRSVVPVVPPRGVTDNATAPGTFLARYAVSHSSVASPALDGVRTRGSVATLQIQADRWPSYLPRPSPLAWPRCFTVSRGVGANRARRSTFA